MRAIVLTVAALLASQMAFADADAEIAYRQGVMSSVGGHMKAIVTILKKGVHEKDLAFHSAAMADLATIVPEIFPAGSGDGKTEALPDIWKKPDEFKKAVQEFVDAANGFDDAVSSGDNEQVGPAIQALGHSCKNCHDNFREEHDH